MANYNFHCLNDKEFEVLSIDLLSKSFGCHIERFKPGKDAGVDGRFFSNSGQETIIQCKHWLKSGLNALLRSIQSTEVEKVRKLSPSRYIFVTSLELSRANKTQIRKLFTPFILTDSDVIGNEDLNSFLAKYEEVERKHYKLWISSTTVLKTIMNSAILGRSRSKLQDIVEESSRYVVTRNHNKAIEKLEQLHTVIITGSPGAGKTTLANQICKAYTAQNYEFFYLENSLNEAERTFDDNAKQIFYFDDFLGRNFLLALNQHQDSHVVNFIKRVKRGKYKRFVLTTRSNILNQGKSLSDLFDIENIDENEYELSVSNLTEVDKAKILYNHIWFGKLDETYIDEIYTNRRYLTIIQHVNFNPRLISFITDSHRLEHVPSHDYWGHIERTLTDPKDLWRNVLESQLDSVAKHVIVGIAISGTSILESELQEFFNRLVTSNLCSKKDYNYNSVIRVLVGALLNRSVHYNSEVYYSLFDPSIADYILANYLSDFSYMDCILYCLRSTDSVDNLANIYLAGKISDKFYIEIVESQLEKACVDTRNQAFDRYKLWLVMAIPANSLLNKSTEKYVRELGGSAFKSNYSEFGEKYFEFISRCLKSNRIPNPSRELVNRVEEWVLIYKKNITEFVPISEIVSLLNCPKTNFDSALRKQYIELLSDGITADVITESLYVGLYEEHQYDDSELIRYIEERVSILAIDFGPQDIRVIAESFNLEEVLSENSESRYDGTGEHATYWSDNSMDEVSALEINDLFDRS